MINIDAIGIQAHFKDIELWFGLKVGFVCGKSVQGRNVLNFIHHIID